MKNRINKLIFLLIAIKELAKFIHYTSKGECFYSKHIFIDAIIANYDTYIDDLKEVCLLGNNVLPVSDYLRGAAAMLPKFTDNDKDNFKSLNQLLKNALSHINDLEDLDRAEENLIGTIAEDIKKFYGLTLRQIQ